LQPSSQSESNPFSNGTEIRRDIQRYIRGGTYAIDIGSPDVGVRAGILQSELLVANEEYVPMLNLKRLAIASVVLVSAGCMPVFSKADYGKGLVFYGLGDVIHQVDWSADSSLPQVKCPIIIHLKDGSNLDESLFASSQKMLQSGGKIQCEIGDDLWVEVLRPEMAIVCTYKKDKLVSVMVNVPPHSSLGASLTVGGKNVSLPITDRKLFEILGEPRGFQKRKIKTWAGD
jgi:hypothetical protein